MVCTIQRVVPIEPKTGVQSGHLIRPRPRQKKTIFIEHFPTLVRRKGMKQILRILPALLLSVLSSAAFAASGWDDDYEKALEKAKTEKKMVLLDFTGSDWCGWCIKLDKEVFSKPEFKKYAKENLVLVEVDFPQNKSQSAKLKAQNSKLQKEHGVRGYPTIVVLDSEGKKVGQLGYQPGGPEAFIGKLNELKSSPAKP